MNVAIWVALIGLVGTVVTVISSLIIARRASRDAAAKRTAEAQTVKAVEEREAADRRADEERAERLRMDARWNELVKAQAAELERKSLENDRLTAANERLREQLSKGPTP